MNLREYVKKLCGLVLVCVLGVSATFQGVAYGVRPEFRPKWFRDEAPLAKRRFCSGDAVNTLNDLEAISTYQIRLEKIHNTPEDVREIASLLYGGKKVSVDESPVVEINDIPNRCSNLEDVEAVFLRGHRLLTGAPPPEEAPRFNFKIMHMTKGTFLGIISLTPIRRITASGMIYSRCIVLKRWLVKGLNDHREVGRILCKVIDVILQDGVLCPIVMDYDADYCGIEEELRVVQDVYGTLYGVAEIHNWIIRKVDSFAVVSDEIIPASVELDIRTKDQNMVQVTYKDEATGKVISDSEIPHCYVDGYGLMGVNRYRSYLMRMPGL